MGTRQWGNSANPTGGTFFFSPNNDAAKANYTDNVTASEDGYIDKIFVYSGAHGGGNSAFKFGIYTTGTHLIGPTAPPVGSGGTNYGTGYGWNSGSYAPGSFNFVASGTSFVGAVIAAGQGLQVKGRGDGGTFEWWNAGSSTDLPNPWSPSGSVTGVGNLAWYVTYFPTATITALTSTPLAPGQTFTITGRSYSAGVNSISINGTAVPTYTVNSDTQITATVPVGATTGTVTVNTNAGSATSSGTLIISSAYVRRSTSFNSSQGIYLFRGSPTLAAQVAQGVNLRRSSVWTPSQ